MENYPNKIERYGRNLAQISLFLLLFNFSSLRALAAPENSVKKLISLTQENLYTKNCRDTARYSNNQIIYSVPEAAYFVAVCLQQDPTTPKALKEAIKLLEYSQSKGLADSAFQLSMSYSNGYGVEIDPLVAIDWNRRFEQLSKPKIHPTMIIKDGAVERVTEADLLKKLQAKAKAGDIEAQYFLAKAYAKGEWGQVNMKKSIHWYKSSAKNGNDNANYMLGYYYCRGIEVEKSIAKANYHIQLSNRKAICK